MEKRPDRPLLPELYELEHQFEQTYHRQMTAEERKWFKFIEKLLLDPSEGEGEKP